MDNLYGIQRRGGPYRLDTVDIGVLRELMSETSTLSLQTDIRRPYKIIARRLGVSDDTIRNRIRAMERKGLIQGWKLGLNPTIFNLETEIVWIEVKGPNDKKVVVRQVRKLRNILTVQNYVDNFVSVNFAYSDDAQLQNLIDALRATSLSREVRHMPVPFPRCRLKLSRIDWRIIGELRRDVRRPFGDLAENLNVSRRTIVRRIRRLIEAGAVFTLPVIDLKFLEGGILSSLSVFYSPRDKMEIDKAIKARYHEYLMVAVSTFEERGWFGFLVPNPSVAGEIRDWAAGLNGAKGVQMLLVADFINLLGEAFDDELEAALRVAS